MNRFEVEKWFDEVRNYGMKPGLSRVKSLLRRMENPQNKLDIIHITGTNGKGSTATLLSSVLRTGDFKVGQFSTPSVLGFNHMFLVNDLPITDDKLCLIVVKIQSTIKEMLNDAEEHPTEYEIIAAIMYQYFYDEHVDFAIVEVAMGGENDCTNVMDYSLLSIVTTISHDHGAFLGDTLEKIAIEKSGVIKHNSVVITHQQVPEVMSVLKRVSDEKMSVLITSDFKSDLKIEEFEQSFEYKGLLIKSKLLGQHQQNNIVGVIEAVTNLNKRGYTSIDKQTLLDGIYTTTYPGRFERIDDWIIDGAHNNESLIALANTLGSLNLSELTGVVGVLKDKKLRRGLIALKPYFKRMVVTEPESFRRLSLSSLSNTLIELGYDVVDGYESIEEAFKAGQRYEGIKIGFGSFYMIESLRKNINCTL